TQVRILPPPLFSNVLNFFVLFAPYSARNTGACPGIRLTAITLNFRDNRMGTTMVNVKILPDKEHASEEVAQMLHDLIVEKPNAVIGVATGSTPEGAYERLAEKIQEQHTDVSQLQFFALDEYIGLPWEH